MGTSLNLSEGLNWEPTKLEGIELGRTGEFIDPEAVESSRKRLEQLTMAARVFSSFREEDRSALSLPPLRSLVYEYNIWRNQITMILADEDLDALDTLAPMLPYNATLKELLSALVTLGAAYQLADSRLNLAPIEPAVSGVKGRTLNTGIVAFTKSRQERLAQGDLGNHQS